MLYNKYSSYLKEKFGERVYRISVDAGFSCPHKIVSVDGTIAGGCIYCNNVSFSFSRALDNTSKIESQIEASILQVSKRFRSKKFILYFQSNTNTFAPVDVLKKIYDVIFKYKNIVGLNISTRPDSINDDILDLIDSYSKNYEVWIEYGVQSICDDTLKLINRGHSYSDFLSAFCKTKKRNIKVCAHLIFGLPNESAKMILDTAFEMNRLNIDGIKIHPMHIVKNTKLAEIYNDFDFNFMELDKYIDILSKFIGYIKKEIIIHGLRGYCPKSVLIKPWWIGETNQLIIESLEKNLLLNNIKQSIFLD